jgi:signal transduction histidine kinase
MFFGSKIDGEKRLKIDFVSLKIKLVQHMSLPGLVPTDNELRANFRILIELRWFTGIGLVIAALFNPDGAFRPAPVLAVGVVYLLSNGALWLLTSRTTHSLAIPAYLQTLLDLTALGILFHFTGGIESPYIIYFVIHLFGTALILSSTASVVLAFAATAVMGMITWLEYSGRLVHFRVWGNTGLYHNTEFIAVVLLVFTLTDVLIFTLGIRVAGRLRRQRREATALYQAARVITSTFDEKEVLNHLLEACATTLNATAGIVRLLSPDGTALKFVAGYGLSDKYIDKGDVTLNESVIDQQAIQSQPVIIEDVRTEQRVMYKSSMLKEHLLSGVVVPIRSADERVLGILRVYSRTPRHFSSDDIPFLVAMTAQAGIALSNAQQYQTLTQIDESETRFVRIVTHELRAPVSGALSLVRNLTDGYVGTFTDQQMDILRRVEDRLDFLQDLITDLLDLAAGKEMYRASRPRSPLNVTDYLQQVCDSLQAEALTKSIRLETNAEWLPGLWVSADAEDLKRILVNLIGNAIKYTPAKGRVVANLSWDDTWLELMVRDSGIGIPKDDLPHIFEEFFRAKNARELERHGTGLGLAIVKQLVERFEGEIAVHSTLGEGTTFTVHLPLLAAGDQPDVTES